jgi:PAS domain-containing protein
LQVYLFVLEVEPAADVEPVKINRAFGNTHLHGDLFRGFGLADQVGHLGFHRRQVPIIDDQKKAQAVLNASQRDMEQAWKLVRHVFDMNQEPMTVLDNKGRVVIVNTVFSELLNVAEKKVNGLDLLSAQPSSLDAIDLSSKLATALKEDKDFTTRPFEMTPPGGIRRFVIRGRVIKGGDDDPYHILLQFVKQPPKR